MHVCSYTHADAIIITEVVHKKEARWRKNPIAPRRIREAPVMILETFLRSDEGKRSFLFLFLGVHALSLPTSAVGREPEKEEWQQTRTET